MELVLFSLLGLVAVLFFVNHLFFGGKESAPKTFQINLDIEK